MDGTTVAVDLAKTVFEVAVANERGQIIDSKRLGRAPFARFLAAQSPARIVMDACGTAHYWGRMDQIPHRFTLVGR